MEKGGVSRVGARVYLIVKLGVNFSHLGPTPARPAPSLVYVNSEQALSNKKIRFNFHLKRVPEGKLPQESLSPLVATAISMVLPQCGSYATV